MKKSKKSLKRLQVDYTNMVKKIRIQERKIIKILSILDREQCRLSQLISIKIDLESEISRSKVRSIKLENT